MLVGELDIATAVHPVLAGHLEPSGATGREYVVADVAGLEFCDCAGLAALLWIHRRAVARGGWLRLSAATPRMRKLLRVSMLSHVLLCYPGIAEAFADVAVPDDCPVAHTGFDESGAWRGDPSRPGRPGVAAGQTGVPGGGPNSVPADEGRAAESEP
ncbi:STAS domain-containing protein [Catenulispora sp. NF23]|uniref:STAS domain-containing protein n=1 Tax=Catenulispora pinistramenti TaxID=2705254 RepID=A0ABS5KKR6_9ACTN|nr:STAS domain-containing protein [Catenulispora pinistramenti]MBS2531179.1 STAS domain-containing protein [Catenulispora pinistramenti]MBS2546636.1 STAS domain-containing protein [Catenulispora pinistramenti]